MKESRTGVDKRLIFRETFDSEDGVRSRGGVPTAVTFQNGVASCITANSSKIYYSNLKLNGTYSVRIKLNSYNPTFEATKFFLDFTGAGGTGVGAIYAAITTGTLIVTTGTRYLNGNVASTLSSSITEIVVSGISLLATDIFLNSSKLSASFNTASYELLEIYKGTLTAQEVKNLYNNSAYKPFIPHGEILGSEKITNSDNRDFTNYANVTWAAYNGSTKSDGIGKLKIVLNPAAAAGQSGIILTSIAPSVGSIYKITMDLWRDTAIYSALSFQIGGASKNITGTLTTVQTTYIIYIQTTSSNAATIIFTPNNTTDSGTIFIDNISVKEVLSTANLILDVNAFKGTIRNRLSGSVLNGVTVPNIVNTNVVAVKDSCGWSMLFNGSTSKLDAGSYNGLTGDITVCAWVKSYLLIDSTVYIVNNNKFVLYVRTGAFKTYRLSSDGAVTQSSLPDNSLKQNIWQFVCFTRKSNQKATGYLNGVLTLSETDSGTISVGTTNIFIGATFKGNIASIRIYQGILSQEEISQMYTSEKSKYNL